MRLAAMHSGGAARSRGEGAPSVDVGGWRPRAVAGSCARGQAASAPWPHVALCQWPGSLLRPWPTVQAACSRSQRMPAGQLAPPTMPLAKRSDWAYFNREPKIEPSQTEPNFWFFQFFGFGSVFCFQRFGVRLRCRFVDVENRTPDQNRSLRLRRRTLPVFSACKCQPHGTKAWPKAHHVDNQRTPEPAAARKQAIP
jgi:hypothetical protein